MPQEAVLKLGYPNQAKVLLCLPLAACLFAVWGTLSGVELGWWDAPVIMGALISCLPAAFGFRTGCRIDSGGITRRSLWGKRRFAREDFLGHERIAAEPGQAPDLLLRFKSGVVFLGASHVDRTAQEVIDFLSAQWQVSAADYQAPELGAVDPCRSFEYETIHVAVLLSVGVLSGLVALRIPVFGMLAVVAAFCFRAAWRALGRLETDEHGLTFSHRFLPAVRLTWNEIESAAYWNSFAQGGVRIRSHKGQTVRIYRWIAGYPLLNRLMHDRLGGKAFWPTLQLPMRVDLNRRRRLGVLAPYVLLMGNALVLLWQGNVVTFAVVSAIPTFVAVALIWGSSRALEFDKDGVRDIWRYMWFEKVSSFRRADLMEARLGRQLTVGGLWMRFGDTRLEIANSDASLPPEQILTCLREQWAWDKRTTAGGDFQADRLRGVA
jgi:hypothetical protein